MTNPEFPHGKEATLEAPGITEDQGAGVALGPKKTCRTISRALTIQRV